MLSRGWQRRLRSAGYAAPVNEAQPAYPAAVLQQPVSYEPVMGVVEPMPVQPAPTSYPPQNGTSS